MSTTVNKDAEFFEQRFIQKVDQIKGLGQLILAYDGVLNSETISKLEGEIEGKILDMTLPKTAVRKVFFICVEALQNMFIHGYRDEAGAKHNFFILYAADGKIKMIGANLIKNGAIERLRKHIERINSFDDAANLKTYYLEHLENNEISKEGGAGLGFITIAMKSGNKLSINFETINDDRSFFLMEVTINTD